MKAKTDRINYGTKFPKLKKGDKVKCVNAGPKDFMLMHTLKARLVEGKIYTVKWVDDTLGNIGLENKGSNWHASRFIKIPPVHIPKYRIGGKMSPSFDTMESATKYEQKLRAKDGIFRSIELK